MSNDIQDFSPLWGNWYLKEKIGKGSYGSVYKAVKQEYNNTYVSAVKHISIPQEGIHAQDIIAEGYATNLDTVYRHYDDLRDKMVKEIDVCYQLRGHTNIVSYEDSYIVPKSGDEKGYDIFIRMELLQSLKEYSLSHTMNEREVIKLGIDMCEALQVLMSRNMMHRDIKPGNIFVNSEGNFKLGDFGEARILMSNTSSMSVAGTYPYMAPEVYRGENANITADIYSLGMVMYRMLNNGRAPFVNPNAQVISSREMEMSNYRRFKGDPFNPPAACGNKSLSEIILRACQFNSHARWQNPLAMKNALISVKNAIEDDDTISVQNIEKTPVSQQSGLRNVSPYTGGNTNYQRNVSANNYPNNNYSSDNYRSNTPTNNYYPTYSPNNNYSSNNNYPQTPYSSNPYPEQNYPQQPRSTTTNKLIIIGILVALALIVAIILVAVNFLRTDGKNSDDDDNDEYTTEITTQITSELMSRPSTETPTQLPTQLPTQAPTKAHDVKISSYKDVEISMAKNELEKQGLTVTETYDYSFDVDDGKIISQSIKAGSTVKSDTNIEFKVSTGAYFSNVPASCEQMLYVKSSGSSASMRLYDFQNGKWTKTFSCSATVGKNGVSSDYYEGKNTTPKGTFPIGTVLSQSKITDNMPWQPCSASTVIVEDIYSPRYNQIADKNALPYGTECDNIGQRLVNGTDNAAIFIEHNGNGYSSNGVVVGRCSSITICGHMSALKATGGCIDISSSDMLTLLSRLDQYKTPYIRTE